jgi:hypothetical protein
MRCLLESFHCDTEDLRYLESLELFRSDFLDYLAELRFRGEIYTVTEGTPVFPNQPLLEVVARIPRCAAIWRRPACASCLKRNCSAQLSPIDSAIDLRYSVQFNGILTYAPMTA